MVLYKNRGANSGVVAYKPGSNFIIIRFKDGGVYLYNYDQPGKMHVDNMLHLAEVGKGLATYINKHVREHYAGKLS